MILNGHDLARAHARITMLKGRCDLMRRRIANPREAALALVEVAQVEKRIDELTEQLQAYTTLRAGRKAPERVALIDIPDKLIQRRIGLGWSHDQLGKAVGQARQIITRYERTRYVSVSLKRLIQIDHALCAEEVRQSSIDKSVPPQL